MNDATPEATPNRYLGIRLAVGLVGLALVALFIMLGRVASKQADTAQALESHESTRTLDKPASPASARE